MKLRTGDMVTVNIVDAIDLFGESFNPEIQTNPVSHLSFPETAVVVSMSSHDGKCVYILGPHGSGWTFGALLKKVK